MAQQYLAGLGKARRPVPVETLSPPFSRLRRLGRRLLIEWERMGLLAEAVWRLAVTPRHRLGRFIVRVRLTARGVARAPLLTALLALAAIAAWRFALRPSEGSLGSIVSGVLFGTVLIGAIAVAWKDLVRCPFAARRIRRRIAKRPSCVLPTTSTHRQAELTARDEEMPIVPREDLYEDVLPGILDRHRGDVQMVVGEPGAGKTTALVGLAERLARIGFVPVVVPMWGEMPDDLVEAAKKRFERNAGSLIGSTARLDEVWQWLRDRRRVVIAIDDADRVAPDGERGFMLRRGLDELAGENLPTIVTTRPAGIPAGLAGSAIDLNRLDEEEAVDHVLRVAREEPGGMAKGPPTSKLRGTVVNWVREGRFAEVPFYLELLARLVAVGRCEELAPARAVLREYGDVGRVRRREDGRCEWNPLWVRFRLLEHFCDELVEGHVHQWLAIGSRERKSCLHALSEAALANLVATALQARGGVKPREAGCAPDDVAPGFDAVMLARDKIEEFLESDDRSRFEGNERTGISAHEVVDTGERLRLLDRDPDGELHFHHRIMQAYLAARCLVKRFRVLDPFEDEWWERHRPEGVGPDWLGALLDPYFPDRLTAQMTLVFAALGESEREGPCEGAEPPPFVTVALKRLVENAERTLPPEDGAAPDEDVMSVEERLDPRRPRHPEAERADPDDALAKLTTAAEIARAANAKGRVEKITRGVRLARGATMWAKLHAIPGIAELDVGSGWKRLWEFARDPDQEVRRAASTAISDDALIAYRALRSPIDSLLTRAALRSAYGLPLESLGVPSAAHHDDEAGEGEGSRRTTLDGEGAADGTGGAPIWNRAEEAPEWDEDEDARSLQALGWVLPAIVSGLREHAGPLETDVWRASASDGHEADGFGERPYPAGRADAPPRRGERDRDDEDGAGNDATVDEQFYAEYVRAAREALEQLVTLAFHGGNPELEASLAQGFKSDAMRHAEYPDQRSGPGLVANNRRFVTDFCIDGAEYWYARLVLYQALALYAIAGANRQVAFDAFDRLLRRNGEPHPFVWRGARLARRAVRRQAIGSDRWAWLIWVDEGTAVSRRPTEMSTAAAQLVADVTLLLNLRESATEDRQAHFPHMRELPYCLHGSSDRHEILGAGCPDACGYGLCPLKQPPPDEPNRQRTVSRAFCRGQYELAAYHRPPWQKRRIRRRALRRFWWQMERRART